MTQATATGITATKPSIRKEKRELLKGVRRVTTDPSDLIQSDDDEKGGSPKRTNTKQGHTDTYQNPPSLPSTIKVKKSSNIHVTSSIPGLSSCGFIMKHTNIRGSQNWWCGMRRIVVKAHTDLCNNAIKNMQMKFKGKEMK